MDSAGETDDPHENDTPRRCDFCRLRYDNESVTGEVEGATFEFCSETCRQEMQETDRVFSEYHGFKRIGLGIPALDERLPEGVPRNSFVLLSGDEGTRHRALHAELVWRTLQRNEPAVIVTFEEPPISVIEQFLCLEWNVFPFLETGQLQILDCFTYRVDDREQLFDRMNDWNTYLYRISQNATTVVRDPSDVGELRNKLDNILSSLDMVDSGAVVIDSLTELGTIVQPVRAYRLVKDLRADISKGRFVPVFAGATYTGDEDEFPHDLAYVIDGLVDMELNGSIVDDGLVKRIRVRKMNGALVVSEWTPYEFTSRRGLVTFDVDEDFTHPTDPREYVESAAEAVEERAPAPNPPDRQ